MSWKEIFVDDIEGLKEWVNVWNSRPDCIVQQTTLNIKTIIEKKYDAHCYMYNGENFKILMFYKYDSLYDTTHIFFQNSDMMYSQDAYIQKGVEAWNAYRSFILMLLNKYNRPVKMVKWDKDIRIQSIIDMAEFFYAQVGIKATNLEHNWLFELM